MNLAAVDPNVHQGGTVNEEERHFAVPMASTIWKGQLTFGLLAFPVRLQKAARRERISLKYVRQTGYEPTEETDADDPQEPSKAPLAGAPEGLPRAEGPGEILPVRQGYFSEGQREPSTSVELQRGYEVAPDKFVVVRSEELKSLRKATSADMQILRSVQMHDIDPVFLENSYYVIPGTGGEKPYSLFYRALAETQLAALAEVAMHGREHVVVLRAGSKGLIAHTMFYVNEVRGTEEYATDTAGVSDKELDLAKKYIEALKEDFRPEEFTDSYREKLQDLIASKVGPETTAGTGRAEKPMGKVVDIMVALRQSLEAAKTANAARTPPASEAPHYVRKPRKRNA